MEKKLSSRPRDIDLMRLGKAAIFDIESTSLDAQYGLLLCVSIKQVNADDTKGKTVTIRIDDPRNKGGVFDDRWVVRETIKELNKYDLLVGWFSSRFDIPFLNTKAIQYKMLPPQRNFRRDLCFVSRFSLKLKNNRLATVGKWLFGESGKTFLDWAVWLKAQRGDKKAIGYIVRHCEKDVLETEKVYKRFIPLLGVLRKN